MTTLLQFFAVIRNSDMSHDLRRVTVGHPLQKTLTTIFREQTGEFVNEETTAVPFSPSYTPSQDEVVVVEGFALPHHLQSASESPQEFDDLMFPFTSQAPLVKAILGIDSSNSQFCFQYFDRSKILRRDFTAIFKGGMFQRLDDPGITLDNHLSALIDGDKLYFRSFHRVRQFLDLDEFFKEATNEDIETILNHEKLKVNDVNQIVESLSPRMRRRFSIVMATKILDHEKVTPQRIQRRAKKFDGLDVTLIGKSGDRKVAFPTNASQMALFLRFLSEELYISELTDQAREANSSRPLT